jgi:hypothetical protein
VLALIALSTIWACASRLLGKSELVDITRATSNIKDFLFVSSVLTKAPRPVNQEHALSPDAIQSFEIALRGTPAKDSETLLFALLPGNALRLAIIHNGKSGLGLSSGKLIFFDFFTLGQIGYLALLRGLIHDL